MGIQNYVSSQEFQQLIKDKTVNNNFLKSALASKGIFAICSCSDDLADIASSYIWGSCFMSKIHESVNIEKNKLKSVVAILVTTEKEFLEKLSDKLLGKARIEGNTFRLRNIVNYDEYLTMDYMLIKRQKGRTQFIDQKEVAIEVKISAIKNDEYKINIQYDSSGDATKVLDLFQSIQNEDKKEKIYSMKRISLSTLLLENKLKLFYDFIRYKHKDWQIENINNVSIDRYEGDYDEENNEYQDELLDERTEEGSKLLEGINSLVLRGNNLNQNIIVKNCQEQKFIFKSMCFRIRKLKEAVALDLEISFKRQDLKVNIIKAYTIDDSEHFEEAWLEKEKQYKYIDDFQNIVYNIYCKLIEKQKKSLEISVNSK